MIYLKKSVYSVSYTHLYSRSAETEADEVGLMLMARSGYNPEVEPGLWQKMAKASGGSKGALDVLASTHPSDAVSYTHLLPKELVVIPPPQQWRP